MSNVLKEIAQRVLDAWKQAAPMQTADYHGESCRCFRCEMGRLEEALGEPREVWPDRLMIRDTGLEDDGNRIYTTAGHGYKRQAYVREDICSTPRLTFIEVIRLIRQQTGCGLVEAKAVVDTLKDKGFFR